MSNSFRGESAALVDLTDVPLEQIARLCGEAAADLGAEDAFDAPVLQRALRRLREEAASPGEIYAGHSQGNP